MKSRLKELRKKLNLTQQDFGKSINLSKSSISNIEGGTINLTDRNVKEICSKHNVNEQWLRNSEGEMFNQMTKDEELAYLVGALMVGEDEFKKDFIKSMLELEKEEDWHIVINLLEGLKNKNKNEKAEK